MCRSRLGLCYGRHDDPISGNFFLYSSINMPLDLSTDEVSELGIYSKLSLVWDNLS